MIPPKRESYGGHLGDTLIWTLSALVIAWAVWEFIDRPASTMFVDECVRRGYIETPEGPVFCVLVTGREKP